MSIGKRGAPNETADEDTADATTEIVDAGETVDATEGEGDAPLGEEGAAHAAELPATPVPDEPNYAPYTRLAAPEGAPFEVVATRSDRALLATSPGTLLTIEGQPALGFGASMRDVDLLSDHGFDAIADHWHVYHDEGGFAELGRDVAFDWQIIGGHTAFVRLNIAQRGHLSPIEVAYRDSEIGEALPVGARYVRWQGLFAAHRGVLEIKIEFYDASDRYLDTIVTHVPEANGGRSPFGYAKVGAVHSVPPSTAAVRFKIGITPFAGADEVYAFFTHLALAACGSAEPDRPIAERLCPLGPLTRALDDGSRVLVEVGLPQVSRGAPPQPVIVEHNGAAYPIGARPALDGVARIGMNGSAIAVETGNWSGAASVMVDGRWLGDIVAAPMVADRHLLPAGKVVADGRMHRLEVISPAGILGTGFGAGPRHGTPWTRIAEDVPAPLPGFGAPLAEYRYRALEAHARALAEGTVDPWLVKAMPALHQALIQGHTRASPFPLRFAHHETPDVSIVIPVHNGYAFTFIALAALRFARVEATFEVIVVDDGSSDETQERLAEHEGITVVRHESARGFLHAANAGAAKARGRYVLLLNNDTEVTAGWLDALLDAFTLFPGAGVVAPKMIYPDGALQDAGGRIDHHGEPTMVGRGGNAYDPRFCYTRDVDYVSGAAMMVDRALWRRIGGFSDAFAPAYYEDVDLCFKVREEGRRVLYVPGGVVVHSEGGSHGVDETAGVKRHQVLNAPVFKRTWAHRRPPRMEPGVAHDRGVTARVLFPLIELPRTDIDAASVAAEEEIRLIKALGAKVTVLPRSLEYLPRYAEAMERQGVEIVYAPFATSLEGFLEERGAEYDAVYVTRYQVAEALLPAIRRYAPDAKVLLNLADLQFLREMRAASEAGDPAALDAARSARAREIAAMRASDVVLSYSDVEASVVFSHLGPEVAVAKVPWVQRLRPDPAPFEGRAGLAFLGNYRHPPNAEAVRWFATMVMPRLQEARPDITFTAYGSYAEDALADIPGIVVGGHVADLGEMFDAHRLFVAPLRSGAGVKGKVFQAMAAGIPSVLTPIAAEGLPIREGEAAFVADTGTEFVDAILAVYDDAERWASVAAKARAFIEAHYGFEQGVAAMRRAFEAGGLFLPQPEWERR
ncbi:glycosyltransferase [Acuticoccus sp. M5D2P5]|uniref:glycosyltransferase n=1 Tax=Acuticoccus kalidii TaxID=2910977 RepID=UPI001F374EF8|nr:glycosyltransferase [Acuticoccus kalidii]MCF3932721.1 glycosyltransferase [Acuticoccus kalidii]